MKYKITTDRFGWGDNQADGEAVEAKLTKWFGALSEQTQEAIFWPFMVGLMTAVRANGSPFLTTKLNPSCRIGPGEVPVNAFV